MDRTLLTSKDMKMIMAGLRSLDSVSGSHYYSTTTKQQGLRSECKDSPGNIGDQSGHGVSRI